MRTDWIVVASLVTVKQGFVRGEIRISPRNLLMHFFHLMIFVDIFPFFICPFMTVLSAPNVCMGGCINEYSLFELV